MFIFRGDCRFLAMLGPAPLDCWDGGFGGGAAAAIHFILAAFDERFGTDRP